MNIGCPRHWPDLYLCDLSCLKVRMEFLKAAEALRAYWREREREAAAREQEQRSRQRSTEVLSA